MIVISPGHAFHKVVDNGIHKFSAVIRLEDYRRAIVGKHVGREVESYFISTLVHEREQNMRL